MIANRLYRIPDARKRYLATIRRLIAEHWDEERLLAETERIEELLTPHLSRTQEWRVDFDAIRARMASKSTRHS